MLLDFIIQFIFYPTALMLSIGMALPVLIGFMGLIRVTVRFSPKHRQLNAAHKELQQQHDELQQDFADLLHEHVSLIEALHHKTLLLDYEATARTRYWLN